MAVIGLCRICGGNTYRDAAGAIVCSHCPGDEEPGSADLAEYVAWLREVGFSEDTTRMLERAKY